MTEQLQRDWQALIASCQDTARDSVLKAEDLMAKCRASDEIQTFARDAVQVFLRYRWDETTSYAGIFKSIREFECAREVCSFLIRSRTFFQLVQREPIADDLLNSFISEVQRSTRRLQELVLIDGLDVYGGPLELEPGCVLRSFNGLELENFLEHDLTRELWPVLDVSVDRLAQCSFLLRTTQRPVLPPDNISIDVRSQRNRIFDVAQPWTNFVNLYSDGTVRPIQLFTKSDHLLEWPVLQQITIGPPHFRFETDEDGSGDWEPFVETQVGNEFVQFAQEMDAGRRAAIAREHRAETALRFFARACVDATAQPWYLDTDQLEDVIVNTVISLETVLLDENEKQKTKWFSRRGAALLSTSDQTLDQTRKEFARLYDLRSRVVHGSQRQTREKLERGAIYAQNFARGALRAFLRLSGDQQALITAVSDPSARERQRQLAQRP